MTRIRQVTGLLASLAGQHSSSLHLDLHDSDTEARGVRVVDLETRGPGTSIYETV